MAAIKPDDPIETHTEAPSNVASLIEFIDTANGKRNLYVAPNTMKLRLRNTARRRALPRAKRKRPPVLAN